MHIEHNSEIIFDIIVPNDLEKGQGQICIGNTAKTVVFK